MEMKKGFYVFAFPCGTQVSSNIDLFKLSLSEEHDCPKHKKMGTTVKWDHLTGVEQPKKI
jgi:hypothetical protein